MSLDAKHLHALRPLILADFLYEIVNDPLFRTVSSTARRGSKTASVPGSLPDFAPFCNLF